MPDAFYARLRETLDEIEAAGLTKPERIIVSHQGAAITVKGPGGRDSRRAEFLRQQLSRFGR